jgi:hypothetical protein
MNKFNIPLNIQNLAINNCIDHYDYNDIYIGIIKKRWINRLRFGIRISKYNKDEQI